MLPEAEQKSLYARSPYNVIRLELAYDWGTEATDPNRYFQAAETYRRWRREGALIEDPMPSMYVLEERFSFREAPYRRIGLLSAVKAEEYESGVVLPHERTETGPVEDRLALMRATEANFSPLMLLYRDDRHAPIASLLWQIARQEPDVQADPPDQPSLRMWRVDDQATLRAFAHAFENRPLYIADGHHRYEAALAYRRHARRSLGHGATSPSQYRMANLIAFDDPGLFLLGYHRAVERATDEELAALRARLQGTCQLERWTPPGNDWSKAFERTLARLPRNVAAFGVAGLEPGAAHIAKLASPPPSTDPVRTTDYERLHREIFEAVLDSERELGVVTVKRNAFQALSDLQSGVSQLAFIMRPVPQDLAEAVIREGKLLPVKSTYFHPKVSAGLVIQPLDDASR